MDQGELYRAALRSEGCSLMDTVYLRITLIKLRTIPLLRQGMESVRDRKHADTSSEDRRTYDQR
jgi:hypothetical protein